MGGSKTPRVTERQIDRVVWRKYFTHHSIHAEGPEMKQFRGEAGDWENRQGQSFPGMDDLWGLHQDPHKNEVQALPLITPEEAWKA